MKLMEGTIQIHQYYQLIYVYVASFHPAAGSPFTPIFLENDMNDLENIIIMNNQ